MGVKTRIRRDDHRGVGLVVPASRRTHMPLTALPNSQVVAPSIPAGTD